MVESKICVCRCAQLKKLLTSLFSGEKSATHTLAQTRTDSTHTWPLFSSAVVWPSCCLYYDIMVCVSQTARAELVKADVDVHCVDTHRALLQQQQHTLSDLNVYRWCSVKVWVRQK